MISWVKSCLLGLLLEGLLFAGQSEPSFSELFKCDITALKEERLLDIIKERQTEIQNTKELWSPFSKAEHQRHSLFFSLFFSTIKSGRITLASEGNSGAYFLYNDKDSPLFIIKPTDEDIYCLNNPKHFACPLTEQKYWPRKDIPPYSSAQREALCYELATLCDIASITPPTFLSIISHPEFHLLSENSFQTRIDPINKEKLCSIQFYIEETLSLRSLLEELLSKGLDEKEIKQKFDQSDFEDVCLFLWIIYDNDAHPSNFRAYKKTSDENGEIIYGIKKIDNGLSLPEHNTGFSNFLTCFPNAKNCLSEKTLFQIANLPLEKIKKSLSRFGLGSSWPALEKRITLLKELAKSPTVTYHDVGLSLSLLE